MKMRISERGFGTPLFEESYPDDFKSPTGISQHRSTLSHRVGDIDVHETWFEGMLITHGQATLKDQFLASMESDACVIEMHFSLSGSTGVKFDGGDSLPDAFASAEHNIIYTPGFSGDMELKPSSTTHHFFEAHLTESFFRRLILEESTGLSALAKKIDRKEMAAISKRNLGITVKMNSIISDIMHCERKGSLQRIYLESKVLELLMLQVEQFESSLNHQKQFRVQSSDIEKLRYAKQLIEEDPTMYHSLFDLARKAGLNEYKLKTGFRELWGTTVFGYMHQLRMEQARKMLLEQQHTVGEVADQAGYRNPHHFTVAFKKYFGCLPSELKNLNKVLPKITSSGSIKIQ